MKLGIGPQKISRGFATGAPSSRLSYPQFFRRVLFFFFFLPVFFGLSNGSVLEPGVEGPLLSPLLDFGCSKTEGVLI